METRANYVLIGAFTLAGFLAILAFFLWFARVELDRQFAYYDIEFPTVSGLSNGSDVRFSGLPVGQVVDVALSPDDTGRIRVRIEVNANTPVRTSSVATIESQGVTGVAYVGLSSGDPRDPLLTAASDEIVPTITAGQSVLQTLTEGAPEIIDELLSVSRQVSELLGEANQARVYSILTNLDNASGDFSQALSDFSQVTETVATATEDIAAFTARLEEISAATTSALATAETTLAAVTDFANRAQSSLDTADAALDSGRAALDTADLFMRQDLPRVVTDLTETTAALRDQIDAIGTDTRAMIAGFRETGTLASDRLRDAEKTLDDADRMLADMSEAMAAVERTAEQFDAFLAGDGTALVNETRVLISDATRVASAAAEVAETDLPRIIEDVRRATDTAARVVEQVGGDLSAAAGRVDGISADVSAALDTIAGTFENANETLTRLNTALETGDSALAAADRAFTSADRVLNEEAADIAAALRDTLGRIDTAVADITADVPAITGELRQTAERANAAFGEVESTANSLGPSLRAFAGEGLPQYARLAAEMRALVGNLEQLVRRIERDPARYFLGREDPVFRR